MSIMVRDSSFDVAILSGPRVSRWPSIGVQKISAHCSRQGLKVGVWGGETVKVRGVLPLPGTGALALIEDTQNRIHRVHARAVVKVMSPPHLPDPFQGWRSDGLLPYETARRLLDRGKVHWHPGVVILGTGNTALRFGSELLEKKLSEEVHCVEAHPDWGGKRYAGWEVERRRFEIQGGKILEAVPLSLTGKAPLLWELRLQDAFGIRVLQVARVVSAGPFVRTRAPHEYPHGSCLYELEQTALQNLPDDVEGWLREEQSGLSIAAKISRALLGESKGSRRRKSRLKKLDQHLEEPFSPIYEGKWLSAESREKIASFSGMPQAQHARRPIAAIECLESIGCHLCETACPEDAIRISDRSQNLRDGISILNESRCTACGLCLVACPSASIVLMEEKPEQPVAMLGFHWRGTDTWIAGEQPVLLNRRGEALGSGRIAEILPETGIVRVEVPTHLVWQCRGIKKKGKKAGDDEIGWIDSWNAGTESRVEISLNGERRLIREGVSIAEAFFETGLSRPEDVLLCSDGSCGLCEVVVDGVKKLACQEPVHRGMAIRRDAPMVSRPNESALCPCLAVSVEKVIERVQHGNLSSVEAVLGVTGVGEGRCHGQLCMESLKRLLMQQGMDAGTWIDWRFPWSEWTLTTSSSQ